MILARYKIILPFCLLFFLILSGLPSCTHDPSNLDGLDTVCFNTQVLPILQTSCNIAGCHDGGRGEGFIAVDYNSVLPWVTPGNPRASKLYKVVTSLWGENMMPPSRPLTQLQRTILEVWIAQGAIDKECPAQGYDGGGGNAGDSVCFKQDVLPLFVSRCASCHDGISHSEDVHALNSYASIMEHVVPFNPSSSSVYRAVSGGGEDPMPPPPNSPLTTSEKDLMRKWITQGALNSDCPGAGCDTTGTIGFTASINPILQVNCVGCHNSSLSSGGINLTSQAQVKIYAQTIRNNHPLLTGVVNRTSGFQAMPPAFSLDACSIRKMELWISQGMN